VNSATTTLEALLRISFLDVAVETLTAPTSTIFNLVVVFVASPATFPFSSSHLRVRSYFPIVFT
jgi:hypothetical protein